MTIAIAIPGEKIQITTSPDTEPFWEAAKAGRLTACQCVGCGAFRMPPTAYCPECQSSEKAWPVLPGTGKVYSYVVCNRSPYPELPDFTYVPVVVDLDGAPGARLVSNLVDVDPEKVTIGMKVTVEFNPIQDGWQLPIFRPA
jgi:uncharacterized protein